LNGAPTAAERPWPLLGASCLASALAAFFWVRVVSTGAHLLHFDAKAHLVVARRVFDSLTPGVIQLGAVWPPLPHILNALPAQNDRLYQSGLFASAIGFASFVLGLVALGRAAALADSWAGVVALSVPAFNPAWLYLQATPLTESLAFGLLAGLLLYLTRWLVGGRPADLLRASVCSALACLVRYEAWPTAAISLAAASFVRPEGGPKRPRRLLILATGVGLVLPIVFFFLLSWVSTGIVFNVMGRENLTEPAGDPLRAAALIVSGLRGAFGTPLVAAGFAALVFVLARKKERQDPLCLAALAGLGPAVVVLSAYLAGHPEKARYTLLLASPIGLFLALATRGRRFLQALTLAVAALQARAVPAPLPIIVEATRDRKDVLERRPILEILRREYRGGRILASMGSLAPILFELKLPLKEIVHEGNGNFWDYAVTDPGREVGWVILARGDILDRVRRVRSRFPESFVPVLEFDSVVIYRQAAHLAPREARGGGQSGGR